MTSKTIGLHYVFRILLIINTIFQSIEPFRLSTTPVWVFVVCVFQVTGLFHLSAQICGHIVFIAFHNDSFLVDCMFLEIYTFLLGCYIWPLFCCSQFPLYALCWEFLIINGCWILSTASSASIEMMIWFLFFVVLMWYITWTDLWILNHPSNPWNKSHWIMVYYPFNVLFNLVC